MYMVFENQRSFFPHFFSILILSCTLYTNSRKYFHIFYPFLDRFLCFDIFFHENKQLDVYCFNAILTIDGSYIFDN